MHLVTLDVESYWSSTHSLTKMSPFEYVMHKDTEIISISVAINNEPPVTVFGEDEVRKLLDASSLGGALVIAHNNEGFDALVVGTRLGYRPKMWGCTLAMARPLFAKTVGLSLAKLSQALGVGTKNATVLHDTRGKHLRDFTPDEINRMRTYNGEDSVLCRGVFYKLRPYYNAQEMFHIDCNIRMVADPRIVIDRGVLQRAAVAEAALKRQAINQLAVQLRDQYKDLALDWDDEDAVAEFVRSEMASAPKTAALLESRGVPVPMKVSPSDPEGKKLVPALAKTDEEFTDMQNHDDPIVAAAVRARLSVKSTILETRIQKFLSTSALFDGRLPVPLKYAGADTTGRDSGFDYNVQNLNRINPNKPANSDALRMSLTAPDGYLIGVADQSGIELRMNHWLWQVPSTAALYAADPQADLYKDFAAYYYNTTPDKVDKSQRQFAKVCQLGLGYSAGAATFQRVARTMGGLHIDMPTAEAAVHGWRQRYPEIKAGWKTMTEAVEAISKGEHMEIGPEGIITTEPHGLRLPSGRLIYYPDLRYEDTGKKWDDGRAKWSWVYAQGRHKRMLHGGLVTENCLAADTLVLTHKGPKPITDVLPTDKLWDGNAWVEHAGLKFMGRKPTINLDGVRVTPDHKVYTNDGWKHAMDVRHREAQTAYTQLFRCPVWGADGASPCEVERAEDAMGGGVRLWGVCPASGSPNEDDPSLRVPNRGEPKSGDQGPRDDQAPCVRGVGFHESPMHASYPPGVQELRGAGHHGVPEVGGVVLSVLGGHGSDVAEGAGPGPQGQQRRVLTGQLPVGDAPAELREPQELAHHPDAPGPDAPARRRGDHRHRADDAALPPRARMASGADVRPAGTDEPVYDILNAGPNHRFTVVTPDGDLMLVHNCIQALARDSVFECAFRFFKLSGFRPIMRLHDELIYLFPKSEAADLLANLQTTMRTPPSWGPSLVLWSEGDVAHRYGAAK